MRPAKAPARARFVGVATRLNLRQARRKVCERPIGGRPAQGSCSREQPGHPSSCSRFPGNQGGQRLEPTVNVHFYPGFRDAAAVCCFGYALSIQFYGHDGTSHFLRRPMNELFETACTFGAEIVDLLPPISDIESI